MPETTKNIDESESDLEATEDDIENDIRASAADIELKAIEAPRKSDSPEAPCADLAPDRQEMVELRPELMGYLEPTLNPFKAIWRQISLVFRLDARLAWLAAAGFCLNVAHAGNTYIVSCFAPNCYPLRHCWIVL